VQHLAADREQAVEGPAEQRGRPGARGDHRAVGADLAVVGLHGGPVPVLPQRPHRAVGPDLAARRGRAGELRREAALRDYGAAARLVTGLLVAREIQELREAAGDLGAVEPRVGNARILGRADRAADEIRLAVVGGDPWPGAMTRALQAFSRVSPVAASSSRQMRCEAVTNGT